ncbi:ABC transporter permease [Thermoactinospora rubra]|uniref:ABC transporter permease n=1 Tax=Thermoactinospora rubra TaxID=1088767 RepID=UPI000A11440C|nr:ABC transporter permease [Thermoactinospora rubra]
MTGALKLLLLILRRDRLLAPLWIIPLALLPAGYAASINELYPTAAARQSYADASAAMGGLTALYGPVYGSGLGELTAWRAGFIPVIIALLTILTVIRHTRTEEEAGRRELIGATVVGRHAGLAAALLAAITTTTACGALTTLVMIGQNLPATGSLALGAQFAATGWIFAAVGGVAAQLTQSAGTARGIAIAALGAAYLLRVAGELGTEALTWASPLGWITMTRPYADNRWWTITLAAALTAALTALAVHLSARRDVGAGLLPDRLGPATAAPTLRSPLALAWRLHRALLTAWIAGFAAIGAVLGGIADGMSRLTGDNQQLHDMMARIGGTDAIADAYFASMATLLGLAAAGYAVQATLRLRAEETGLRAEPVLTASVSRTRWAAGHLAFSLLGTAAVLTTGGAATGLAHGLTTGDLAHQLGRVTGAALVQLPAAWVLAAVTVALTGLLPRLAAAAWGVLALCLVINLVGALAQLDERVMDISPFTHLPKVPAAPVTTAPLLWLTALAAVLTATGLYGLRRRDIPVT